METDTAVPDGFAPHFRKSGMTDPWEPIYSKKTDRALHIGLRAAAAHTNSRGFVHGGLIATLADNAMGLSCAMLMDNPTGGLVTVSLSVDFLSSASVGDWLEIKPEVVKVGRRLSFVTALVTANDKVCARANATFQAAGA